MERIHVFFRNTACNNIHKELGHEQEGIVYISLENGCHGNQFNRLFCIQAGQESSKSGQTFIFLGLFELVTQSNSLMLMFLACGID